MNNIDLSSKMLEIAKRYIDLEVSVKEVVADACQPVCSVCVDCCCAVRFCRESVASHWLMTIAAVSGQPEGEFDVRGGWLSPQGCHLKVGRPPVCYEFFCDAIIMKEKNLYRRYALKVLGRLIGFVGRKALGGRHLVTLSESELQNRFQMDKFLKKLHTAEGIFSDCREIIRTGHGRLDRLKLVLAPPEEIRE